MLGRQARWPAHLVFVIDASGSMDAPDRLPLVKYALGLLVEQLGERDRVLLVSYDTDARLVHEWNPKSTLSAARPEILRKLEAIQCAGATNMIEGLRLGYEVAERHFQSRQINRVILCSDGIANVGAMDAAEILQKVEAFKKLGLTFTSVGFGVGNYNDALLEELANKGDGNYLFVDSRDEARRVFVDQLAATIHMIAKDAKIQVEFNPTRVRRYRRIGYENRDIADKDFRNDAVDAGEVGSGQSATALYELELQGDLPAAPLASARAGAGSDIGTVYVRYRDIASDKVEEMASRLESRRVRRGWSARSRRACLPSAP